MKRKSYLVVTSVLLIIYFSEFSYEYQMQVSEEDEAGFCKDKHKHHYILKPKVTCCNMTVIKTGIDIEKHWEECSKIGDDDENVLRATWRIYGCIIKSAVGTENEITLEKFSELMTAHYDEVWKKPIMEKVASITKTAAYDDMKGLNAIRVAYFDIENQVCSGTGGNEVDLKERECLDWEEENHRGGSCCGKASYPIDIHMQNPVLGLEFPISPETCKDGIATLLDEYKTLETMREDIALICDFSCYLLATGRIDWDPRKYWDLERINIDDITKDFFPSWISTSVKKQALEYISSNINATATRINMENYEFPGVVKTNATVEKEQGVLILVQNITNITKSSTGYTASEFMRRTYPQNILFFPTMCTIHKEILGLVRQSLYMNCDKDDAPTGTEAITEATEAEAKTQATEGEAKT